MSGECGGKPIRPLSNDEEEKLDLVKRYVGENLLCQNLQLDAEGKGVIPDYGANPNPARRRLLFDDMSRPSNYLTQDYKDLHTMTIRHPRCTESYCLVSQKGRRGGPKICKSSYPWPLHMVTSVIRSLRGFLNIEGPRNDSRSQRHLVGQLLGRRANCDASFIVKFRGVLQYITKYICKMEKISSFWGKTLQDFFEVVSIHAIFSSITSIMCRC